MASLPLSTFAFTFPNKNSRLHSSPFRPKISCKASHESNVLHDDDNNTTLGSGSSRVDRRNLLMGFGTAAAAGLSMTDRKAFGLPIQPPDLSKCHPAVDVPDLLPECCPPLKSTFIDFKLPPPTTPLRTRPAAHLAHHDPEYLAKYKEAVKRMRALPADDPRNFTQQANVHCAYCEGSYDQVGFPHLELQVHFSWLFFPWHRFFLYFHERILGKLIGDETFALPFWNWDHPDGMKMPAIYTDHELSPLYDVLRDAKHQPRAPFALIHLDYNGYDCPIEQTDLINLNLTIMHRQMISQGKDASYFMGAAYLEGDDAKPGAGSLELVPHNTVHKWTGDRNQRHHEDMGSFYSAARDPIFYAHHTNVDRLWNVWKTLGGKRKDFTDDDWLNSAFLFYDENAQLVRVKVKDCLDSEKLRYTYQNIENLWIKDYRPTRATKKSDKSSIITEKRGLPMATFPVILDSVVTTTLKRPKISRRSQQEKEEEEELLVIDEIEIESDDYIKFDVYINIPENQVNIGPGSSEFAGSFVHLPHRHKRGRKKTQLKLGITDLLEDLEAEDDESVFVTLVSRSGIVKIGGINIEFSK